MKTYSSKTIDANDQITKIRQVESWLAKYGLNVQTSRYASARNRLIQGVLANEIDEDEMVPFQWAHQELDDYLQIHEFLRSVSHRRFLDTLSKSLKGPHQNCDEHKAESGAGRNFMFELVLAAKLAELGFDVSFDGDADAILRMDKMIVHVECKQMFGENIDALLRDAFRQIRRRCDQAVLKGEEFGIGAICLTRYFAQESNRNGPLIAEPEAIAIEMKNTVSKFDFSYLRKDFPQSIGVITHFALPFWNPDDMRLTLLRRFDFYQLLPDHNDAVQKFKKKWSI